MSEEAFRKRKELGIRSGDSPRFCVCIDGDEIVGEERGVEKTDGGVWGRGEAGGENEPDVGGLHVCSKMSTVSPVTVHDVWGRSSVDRLLLGMGGSQGP